MMLQQRIDSYRIRGFPEAEAEVLILIEEAAAGLFAALPDRFILIGGAALVFFHASPRLSRDFDLLASSGPLPDAQEVQAVLRSRIMPFAEIFELGQIEFRQGIANSDFARQWVLADQKTLFSVDFTKIGGRVVDPQIVRQAFVGTPEKIILTPTANYLLLQKCEAFLGRRYVKSRDAFDIQLLVSRGTEFGQTLLPHLEDFIAVHELDKRTIEARIDAVTAKLCAVELRPVLPLQLFEQLESDGFEGIRKTLRALFSDWLNEGRL